MNKLIPLLVLVIGGGILFAQLPNPPSTCCADYAELSFEVEAGKPVYLPYEPMQFRFRLVNRTSRPINASRPDFVLSSRLSVTGPDQLSQEIDSLSLSSGGGPSLPGTTPSLNPNEKYEDDAILAISPEAFMTPGVYQLRFSMNGLESKSIQILVQQPNPKEREAIEFIERNGRDPRFGSLSISKSDARVVKDFIARFGDSPYADFAMQTLARHYARKGKYDEATALLRRVKNSSVTALAKQATKELAEIEEKTSQGTRVDQ